MFDPPFLCHEVLPVVGFAALRTKVGLSVADFTPPPVWADTFAMEAPPSGGAVFVHGMPHQPKADGRHRAAEEAGRSSAAVTRVARYVGTDQLRSALATEVWLS